MKVILLIDDDVEDHDTITRAFYAADPTVHCLCYRDCSAAIFHFTNHTIPQVHCILVDLHMPRISPWNASARYGTYPPSGRSILS